LQWGYTFIRLCDGYRGRVASPLCKRQNGQLNLNNRGKS
jgi:hypothetical protein